MTNSRRARKNINKELMFNKIMPSYLTNTYNEYYGLTEQRKESSETFKIREKIMGSIDDRPLVRENHTENPSVQHSGETKSFSVQNNQPSPTGAAVPVSIAPAITVAPVIDDKPKYINITEEVLYSKLTNMIAMFKCCNCEKCRQSITLQVLNNVKPEYVYKKPSEVKELIESNNYVDINQPIIRAILDTKSNPPHKK